MENAMKKYLVFIAAVAAVACSKNEVPSIDGGKNEADQKYVIYAEDVNTRTVTDASFTVTWTNNDNLAVYTPGLWIRPSRKTQQAGEL